MIPLRTAPRIATTTMQTMSKAPITPLVTPIVNILESFTVTVVFAFIIGVIVAGDVESSTVAVEDSPGFFIVDEVKATV